MSVLDGGLKKWISENKITNSEKQQLTQSNYHSNEHKELVKSKFQIDENISKKKYLVVDARSKDRFEGKVKEPREGLRSGSILNSKCLPFSEVLNKEGTFKDKNELKNLFKSTLGTTNENDTVFSCGSGVTACVLAFAYYLINDKYLPKIYDGSWAEYGKL